MRLLCRSRTRRVARLGLLTWRWPLLHVRVQPAGGETNVVRRAASQERGNGAIAALRRGGCGMLRNENRSGTRPSATRNCRETLSQQLSVNGWGKFANNRLRLMRVSGRRIRGRLSTMAFVDTGGWRRGSPQTGTLEKDPH